MPNPTVNKLLSTIGIALAAFPLLILLVFYAYVLRTRLAVGYWPYLYQPESWSMGFTHHYAVLRPWFHVFPLGLLPIVAAIYNATFWAVSRRFPKLPVLSLVISAIMVYACVYTDPGRFIEWFLD